MNVLSFEMKRSFGRLTTYIYIALILVAQGYFITNINFYGGSPGIEYTAELLSLPLMLSLPILIFPSFSSDKKLGFDAVLSSLGVAPVRLLFVRAITSSVIFLLSAIPLFISPLLLSAFCSVNVLSAFSGIAGYILFGFAIISMGLLVSAVTPSPLFSALFTYGAVLIMYLCEFVHANTVPNVVPAFFTVTIFLLLLSLAFMRAVRSDIAWLALFAITEAAAIIIRLAFPEILTAFGETLLTFIGIRSALSGFCYGLFDISSALNTVLFSALMLMTGVLALVKEKHKTNIGKEPAENEK